MLTFIENRLPWLSYRYFPVRVMDGRAEVRERRERRERDGGRMVR